MSHCIQDHEKPILQITHANICLSLRVADMRHMVVTCMFLYTFQNSAITAVLNMPSFPKLPLLMTKATTLLGRSRLEGMYQSCQAASEQKYVSDAAMQCICSYLCTADPAAVLLLVSHGCPTAQN